MVDEVTESTIGPPSDDGEDGQQSSRGGDGANNGSPDESSDSLNSTPIEKGFESMDRLNRDSLGDALIRMRTAQHISGKVEGISETTDLINGTYKQIRLIGQGAKGRVILAEHILLETRVALKLLHPGFCREFRELERLRQEASICASCDHRNLVRVRDFGTTSDGSAFIVLDYAEGRSLREILDTRATRDNEKLLDVLSQVTLGIMYLHENNIMHRDIKPENILVGTDGVVKLIDFGIAKPEYQDGAVQALTQTGELLGSPYYMSPEQCQGGKQTDNRSDLYSLGCVIFEMVNGKPPLRGETILKTLDMHVNQAPSREGSDVKSVDGALLRIALKCLAKRPEDRYQTASEIHNQIEALKPRAQLTKTEQYIKIAMGALCVLVLISVAAVSFYFGKNSVDQVQGVSVRDAIRALFATSQASSMTHICAYKGSTDVLEKVLESPDLNDAIACNVGVQYCQNIALHKGDTAKKDLLIAYQKLEPRLANLSKADKSAYKDIGIGAAPMLYLYGAQAMFKENDLETPLALVNKGINLVKRYPKSKWTLGELRLMRGLIFDMQGKYDDAIEDLEFSVFEFRKDYGDGGHSIVTSKLDLTPTTYASSVLCHALLAKGDTAKADEYFNDMQNRASQLRFNLTPFRNSYANIRQSLIVQLTGKSPRKGGRSTSNPANYSHRIVPGSSHGLAD